MSNLLPINILNKVENKSTTMVLTSMILAGSPKYFLNCFQSKLRAFTILFWYYLLTLQPVFFKFGAELKNSSL